MEHRSLRMRGGKFYTAPTQPNSHRTYTKKAMRELEKQIAKEAKNNTKAFYAYARRKMKTKEGVADLDVAQGDTTTSDKDKARVL